jgi:hypothetical protein
MQTSEKLEKLPLALLEFHKKVGKIIKSDNNPFFKSKYASLATILDVITEPLTDCGLIIIQFPTGLYQLTTRLQHTSGEYMQSTYEMQPVKHSPQDAGSVITYQRRYAIGAILNLNIDEDDDGNKASQGDKLDKNVIDLIAKADSVSELEKVFLNNKNLHKNNEFLKLVKEKKEFLQ